MSTNFIREARYTVLKNKDIFRALTQCESAILTKICHKIDEYRMAQKRGLLQAVVVERDWPEYEPTWQAIEARMTGAVVPKVEQSIAQAAVGSSVTLTKREIRAAHEYASLSDGDLDYEDQDFVIEYKSAGVVKNIDDPFEIIPAGYYIAELDVLEEGWTLLVDAAAPSQPLGAEQPTPAIGAETPATMPPTHPNFPCTLEPVVDASPTILEMLKLAAEDPMWSDHCEMSKKSIRRVVAEFETLQAQLKAHEEAQASTAALVRELDVALNGAAGAAPQASLCDIVAQVKSYLFSLKQEDNKS